MIKLQPFWEAKHSQIYPLLARLEERGYVAHTIVPQQNKPNKKVYAISEQGRSAVRQWVVEPASPPVTRDELVLKTYCLWLAGAESTLKLFQQRLSHSRQRMEHFSQRLEELKKECGGRMTDMDSPHFSRYLLLNKGICSARSQAEWCDWVISLLKKEQGTNFFDHSI